MMPSRRQGSTGTRSRTGPARPISAAGTTSRTGAVTTGGGSAQVRTLTSARELAAQDRCPHGVGGTAHSYLGPRAGGAGSVPARRWWNVKHPLAYSRRLAEGLSPEDDGEDLTPEALAFERIMLGLRLADGLEREAVGTDKADAIAHLIADGVLDGASALRGRLVLTRRGRLLADAAIRALA